jgi:hypothetical protein
MLMDPILFSRWQGNNVVARSDNAPGRGGGAQRQAVAAADAHHGRYVIQFSDRDHHQLKPKQHAQNKKASSVIRVDGGVDVVVITKQNRNGKHPRPLSDLA